MSTEENTAVQVEAIDESQNDAQGIAVAAVPLHLQEEVNSDDVVRNIVSYLTLADAALVASSLNMTNQGVENWAGAGGTPYQWSSQAAAEIPALLPVSNPQDESSSFSGLEPANPIVDPDDASIMNNTNTGANDFRPEKQRRHTWAQQRLAEAIFTHPDSLRSFCVEAYQAAQNARSAQQMALLESHNRSSEHFVLLDALVHHILNNVPASVALDVIDRCFELSLDTTSAAVHITCSTSMGVVNAVVGTLGGVWDGVIHFSPISFAIALIQRPFNAMGKTTEVFVTGIQSVATGVGSASSLALNRLSAKNASTASLAQQGGRRNMMVSPTLNKELIRKLSDMQAAAPVIAYTELADDTGGLSRHAMTRVQKTMHYDVSLRPFVATIKLNADQDDEIDEAEGELSVQNSLRFNDSVNMFDASESHATDPPSNCSSPESPFMCTPQSFPPTPASRQMVLARGTRFADDVIFLARDQLRVHDALDSENERTRQMAVALTEGKRLAVFDADDASAGIDLTCGQHVATKVGSMLYSSSRSMVPILRNCFVYFEMTVLPKPNQNMIPQMSMATLSIGLSTKEMPPDTLVGAWKGSVGLCTTGQMLTAGQWCTPADPTLSCFGDSSTVGCLVCLDDGSAFETWDGVMVTAAVTFSVNERIVSPPVSTLPMATPQATDGGASTTPVDVTTSGSDPATQKPVVPQATPPPANPAAPPSFTLPLLVPAEEELYPTVTLHSPGTSVMCRFSAGDVVAARREVIGAPPGVTVYAADGSVILSETD